MKFTKTDYNKESLALDETLFHVANGYLGVRGSLEEGCPNDVTTIRGCYINGFYDTVKLHYPERLYGFPEEAQRLVNLPDVQTVKLFLDGEEFSLFSGEVLKYERTLDMEAGTTTRKIRWKSPKKQQTVDIEITRMASFTRPELFLTTYAVASVDFVGTVEFLSDIDCNVSNYVADNDPRVASEKIQHIFFDSAFNSSNICSEVVGNSRQDIGMATCFTGVSNLQLATTHLARLSCFYHTEYPKVTEGTIETDTGIESNKSITIYPGDICQLDKFIVMSDSRRQKSPRKHVKQVILECGNIGAKALLQEQADFMKNFWHSSKMEIHGCPELQEGMLFNLYQLLQSAGRDSISSVASKGISGEGYEGHYFWDTEIYIFPFFLYTQPEIAKNLLDFRYNTLDGARKHAIIMGHKKGALYPWRTISGSECSSFFPAGSAQYHLTGDVAHAFMQYYYVTDDVKYMAEYGAEVLLESARLWLDTGNYGSDGKFHIHSVTGPDEYTCCVSDNYYTNRSAQHNLLGAVEVYLRLKEMGLHESVKAKIKFEESELKMFTQAANDMFFPFDAKLGIHAQDSTFLDKPIWDLNSTPKSHFPLLLHYHPLYLYRFQVCKQADTVLSHFLFEEDVTEDVIRNSYMYYDKITTHDSSLSECVFGIMASRLGLSEKAYKYFSNTVWCDLGDKHGNTKDGLHVANLGGTWLAMVFGFAGLRLKKDGLHFRFTIPNEWEGYSFRLRYRNSLLEIDVNRKYPNLAKIDVLSGEPVPVKIM